MTLSTLASTSGTRWAALVASSLLLTSCRDGSVTAQMACATLSGKPIGGAMLTTAVIPASGTVPMYCKVNGTLAPALNFELRLPDAWNGKLYYAGGGGYDGTMTELVVPALTQGYAEVVSDSGHQGDGMSAAFALTDTFAAQLFGSLSVPTVMSTALKIVTAAYRCSAGQVLFRGLLHWGTGGIDGRAAKPEPF